jgi:hypothetical protein
MLAECGCGLQFPSDSSFNSGSSIFVSDWSGRALMNINGVDVTMYGGGNFESERRYRRGDRFYGSYSGGNTSVRVNYVVTDTCDETENRCRLTYVRATLRVTRRPEAGQLLGRSYSATGACGCP